MSAALEPLLHDAASDHLAILGGFHPAPDDGVPVPCATVLLLGPGVGFWPALTATPEWRDGAPDPVDRWSARMIKALAGRWGGMALFPFGGPPYLPFYTWALRTGRVHRSPVQLLVHDEQGLMVSFRGALTLPDRLDLPPAPASPCRTCAEQPCRTACPVDALGETYDLAACKSFLDKLRGCDCMAYGCAARRACPVSAHAPREAGQSAYHMKVFKG